MAAALVYLIIIAALIYHNRFFSIFAGAPVSNRAITLLFVGKALAVPVFYFVYSSLYGGIEAFDTGKFYNDVQVINAYAFDDTRNFLKILTGMQEESRSSEEFRECLTRTLNWENGTGKQTYNDNRLLIRIHTVLHFIAFNSWFVHALISCFFSFAGLFLIYRSFSEYFAGKEIPFLLIICFWPALWFYTGGFLKEGLTLLVMGCSIYLLKQLVFSEATLKSLWLLILFPACVILKPYVLFFALLCFGIFFLFERLALPFRAGWFVLTFIAGFILLNFLAVQAKGKTLGEIATRHQQQFKGVANGGIFLAKNDKYLQLPYDTTLVHRLSDSLFIIKAGVKYLYWEDSHNQDTLFNNYNTDTITRYNLVFKNPPAGSNLETAGSADPVWKKLAFSFRNALLAPFFFRAGGAFGLLASFENLIIMAAFVFFLIHAFISKEPIFLPLVFVLFAISLCLLFGYSTPNTGAILRYRAPVIIYLLLAALYYKPVNKRTATSL
jgi:hypothetical protein